MNYIDLPSGYKFKNAYGERILPKSFKVFEAGQYVLEKKLALRMSQSELMNALYQWIYLPLQLTYLEIETATIPKSTAERDEFQVKETLILNFTLLEDFKQKHHENRTLFAPTIRHWFEDDKVKEHLTQHHAKYHSFTGGVILNNTLNLKYLNLTQKFRDLLKKHREDQEVGQQITSLVVLKKRIEQYEKILADGTHQLHLLGDLEDIYVCQITYDTARRYTQTVLDFFKEQYEELKAEMIEDRHAKLAIEQEARALLAPDRLRFKLTVPEVAKLFDIMSEAGIIHYPSKTAMAHFIHQSFSTPDSEKPGIESVRRNFSEDAALTNNLHQKIIRMSEISQKSRARINREKGKNK